MTEALSHLFKESSCRTVTAATVQEARNAVLTEGPFKVVVCDFQLPDGDGLQFLFWLRRKRRHHARFLLINFPWPIAGKEPALNGPNSYRR